MSRLCRDENCTRMDLHLEHEVVISEADDERNVEAEPWKKSAPRALDHSIAKATSKTYPKPFNMILRDVEDDYGSCNSRTVQRRLARLVHRGHVLRINLGRRLYAYVRPGSSITTSDIEMMREQFEDLVAQ